jgi:hypothetical protein
VTLIYKKRESESSQIICLSSKNTPIVQLPPKG